MLLTQKNGNCAIFGDFQTETQRKIFARARFVKARFAFIYFYKLGLFPPDSAGFGSPVISGSNSDSSNTGVIVALAE